MGLENIAIVDCISESLDNGVYIAGALTGQSFTAESNASRWRLCTKYYHVDLNVWITSIAGLLEPHIQRAETKAILFYWDGLDKSCFQACWDALSNRESVAVRLLLSENDVPLGARESALQWCVENAFEMVILHPREEMIAEAAENCEKIGLDRVIEALQAYEWSNLVREDGRGYLRFVNGEEAGSGEPAEDKSDINDEERCSSSNSSSASFTDLYENFSSMVAHSRTLSGDERKDYAAQVAINFWNSLKTSEHPSSTSSSSSHSPGDSDLR